MSKQIFTQFIHHAANGAGNHVPNSISAVGACLQAGAKHIEIDIIPLKDGEFALFHNHNLEDSTNGCGPVTDYSSADISQWCYIHQGVQTKEAVGLLSQAVPIIKDASELQWLQLDLKPYTPLTADVLENLLEKIQNVSEKVLVSCIADWSLRLLRKLDSGLKIGFDPLLYLEIPSPEPRPADVPPFRVGAFGLLDDHPLSAYKWGKTADYLAARAEVLMAQAPKETTWFIHAPLLKFSLENNFNWIEWLHNEGARVSAWTLDPQENQLPLAQELIDAGVDFITSNNPTDLKANMHQ